MKREPSRRDCERNITVTTSTGDIRELRLVNDRGNMVSHITIYGGAAYDESLNEARKRMLTAQSGWERAGLVLKIEEVRS